MPKTIIPMFYHLLNNLLYPYAVKGQALGLNPPKSLLYHPLLECLALQQGPMAHPYHLLCSVIVRDCTTDQLHAPIVYKHQTVMKPELPVF